MSMDDKSFPPVEINHYLEQSDAPVPLGLREREILNLVDNKPSARLRAGPNPDSL